MSRIGRVHMPSRHFAPALAALAAALSCATGHGANDEPQFVADYRIRAVDGNPPQLFVDADLETTDGLLVMATGGGIDHLPNQWATFVKDLKARDRNGRALALEFRGPEGWSIQGNYAGRIKLSYRVDLAYAMEPWPPGNEQAGIWMSGALYTVTKPLFITGHGEGASRVAFMLPDGWRVSTPWEPDLRDAGTFVIATREELVDNSLVLGRHFEKHFEYGPFKISLALLGKLMQQEDLVAAVMDAVAHHVNRVFPRTPPSRYLVTIFHAPQNDGEAFVSSSAFTTDTVPTPGNIMSWGNTLAHETYHIWIGGPIHGDEDDVFEWFDEGFTDYYADLALVQSRLIDPATFLRKAEKVMGRYSYYTVASVYGRQSAFEASRNKGRNRFGVYDGGWATAFCLDGMIQQDSNGERSLDDAMRVLHERYALNGKPFSRADFVAVMSEAAGTPLSDFFGRYVEGAEPLPLRACLERAGLEGSFQDYAADAWISPVASPTASQRKILERITRGPATR